MIPFTPAELGLPDYITDWRPQQHQVFGMYFGSDKRCIAPAVPTGGGKTGAALAVASTNTGRTAILTSTNGLLDQYCSEAGSTGLIDIKGRANYNCAEQSGRDCSEGAKNRCASAHTDRCPYFRRYQEARQAKIIVTNYAYFTAIHKYGDGLGGVFDTLVLDESHAAPDEICRAAAIEFDSADVYHTLDFRWPEYQYLENMASWTSWAKVAITKATSKMAEYEAVVARVGRSSLSRFELQEFDTLKNLRLRLKNFIERQGAWEVESIKNGHHFEPLWAYEHADEYLFQYGRRLLALSATQVPKTLHMMGLTPENYFYQEFPAVFDPRRCPVYLIPSVNMTYGSSPSDIDTWISRHDMVMSARLDRKGIIMSHSHTRAQQIIEESRHREYILSNSDRNSSLPELLEIFRASEPPPPTFFCSASLTTGYNFPGRECEFTLLSKMPYPNTMGRIMKARAEADKQYKDYIASQNLIQSCGRGMRSDKDRCENFAVDNLIGIHIWRNAKMYPNWFRRQVKRVESLPKAPPRLTF